MRESCLTNADVAALKNRGWRVGRVSAGVPEWFVREVDISSISPQPRHVTSGTDKRRSIELSCLHRQPTGSCSSVHRIDVAGFLCIWWLIGSVPKRPWVAA